MCHEQWALTVIKLLRFFVLIIYKSPNLNALTLEEFRAIHYCRDLLLCSPFTKIKLRGVRLFFMFHASVNAMCVHYSQIC